jgi:hypothetical protein
MCCLSFSSLYKFVYFHYYVLEIPLIATNFYILYIKVM